MDRSECATNIVAYLMARFTLRCNIHIGGRTIRNIFFLSVTVTQLKESTRSPAAIMIPASERTELLSIQYLSSF